MSLVLGAKASEVTLIPTGSVWKYHNGTTLDGWRSPSFNDADWASGPAKLGYGDSNDITITDTNAAPHPITTYFRNTLMLDSASYTGAVVRLLRDDGAVVYVNGTEVAHSNMPDGTVSSNTLATVAIGDGAEDTFYAYSFNSNLIHPGTNVVAVEVHQVSPESSDIGFDLQLIGINSSNTIPVVSIEATKPNTGEPIPGAIVEPAVVTLHRTGDVLQGLTVYISIGGTAIYGKDYYLAASNSVRFEAGKADVQLKLAGLADDLVEGDETVSIEVVQPPTAGAAIVYNIDPDKSKAVVTIHDEDKDPTILPLVSVEATDADAAEPTSTTANTGMFTFHRSGPTNDPLTLKLYIDGTAIAGTDYRAFSNTVTFAAGETNAFISVIPFADDLVEVDEYVAIDIAPASYYAIVEGKQRGVVIIHDGPRTNPVVSIVATHADAKEPTPDAVSFGEFTVSRTGSTDSDLRVYLGYGGTATSGKDYNALSNTVIIPAGSSSTSFLVTPLADNLIEGDETVVAELSAPPTDSLPPYHPDPDHRRAVVTIHDTTPTPPPPTNVVVSVVATKPNASEPDGTNNAVAGEFTFHRTGPTNTSLTITFGVGGTATLGSDYTMNTNTLTFPAGWAEANRLVSPLADNLAEGDETVLVQLIAFPQYTTDPTNNRAIVTIHDSAPAPTNIVVSVEATKPDAYEPPSPSGTSIPGLFTFRRTGPTNVSITVAVHYGGTAIAGTDYSANTNAVLLPAGVAETVRYISPLVDTVVEGDETVNVELIAQASYTVDTNKNHATVTIHDAAALPIVSIVATTPETTEPLPGESPLKPGAFTLTRTGSTNDPLTVYLGYGGGATPGKDYVTLSNTVTFAAGSSNATLYVVPLNDDLVEGDETVVAELLLIPGSGIPKYNADPDHRRAVVTIHDINKPVAHIDITEPDNGDEFHQGSVIDIKATAVDPAGYISRVEFLDGTNKIGVSEVVFIRAPDPGTPIAHEFKWSGASVGSHTLTARGTSSSGIVVTSAPVTIKVVALTQIVLALEVSDGSAAEPNPLAMNPMIDTGLFLIKRVGGPTNIPVTAYYQVSGTASNGVDYVKLSGQVELSANQMRAEVRITPLADSIKEGDETVTLKLVPPICPAIVPPPADCYLLGDNTSGTVTIHDFVLENRAPVATIAKPLKGSVFTVGDSIEIVAEASDADGSVTNLQVFADNHSLGSGPTNRLVLHWGDATVGTHYLVAKATDNLGKVGYSDAVAILVREKNAVAFVIRNLPDAYTPGTAFQVELKATPPSSAHAWAVEDRPPLGWTVSAISNDGFFDAITGKVKWGPFTDTTARTLTYSLTPPATASGRREFGGAGSIDGVSYPIGGDQSINQGSTTHPADTNGDFRMIVDEVTAYAALWKTDTNTANPTPLSFVTRAGYLWKHGEYYRFDGSFAPPLCWVPGTNTPAGDLAADGTTTSERTGPEWLKPGVAADMQINITPPAGTSAYGVEEHIPVGWAVSNISDDGSFDSNSRTIRWGIFYDATARNLKYTITPPTNAVQIAYLRGYVSFDGHVREIGGDGRVVSVDLTQLPKLGKCEVESSGGVRIHFDGEAGQVGVLQRSSDLVNWEDVITVFLPDGTLDYLDETGGARANIYYRLQVR